MGINTIVVLYVVSAFLPISLCLSVIPLNSPSKKYFDLSYSFDKDTIYFPGQLQYELHMDYVNISKPGFTYSAYSFCMGEHGGTHLDAPYHFDVTGWTVDQIPANNLIDVPAVLIDVEKKVNELKRPHEFLLDVNHIEAHEQSHGFIPSGSVVLINTGWSKFWPNKIEYLGWDNSTSSEGILSFPGISGDAAKFLAKDRKIIGIGLDTASIDHGSSVAFPAHVVLAKEQIYNLENVANLNTLASEIKEDCQLRLFVLPLKIVGGTGAPARILAYCK